MHHEQTQRQTRGSMGSKQVVEIPTRKSDRPYGKEEFNNSKASNGQMPSSLKIKEIPFISSLFLKLKGCQE